MTDDKDLLIKELKKEIRELKKGTDLIETEKKFQKDLYENRLDDWSYKNFTLRNWFISNKKEKELEQLEKDGNKKWEKLKEMEKNK